MNVFNVCSFDKYGISSTSVSVGCYYTSTLKSDASIDVEALKEEYGLDYIYMIENNGNEDNSENTLLEKAEIENNSEITIYPNPATDKVFVNGVTSFNASVYGLNGKILFNLDNISQSIDISGLANGVYFIHITTKDKNKIEKIVKQ